MQERMPKRTPKRTLLIVHITIAAALLAAAPMSRAQNQSAPLSAVKTLDLNHITGTWYEIARYPYNKEKRCVADTFELIALSDKAGQLQLVDSCMTKQGFVDARNLTAKAASKDGDGEFKVRTLFPFSRKYWVLALGVNDAWAVLGSPNRKTLWIFSKTPTLAPDVLATIEAVTSADGFTTGRLIFTPQTTANNMASKPASPVPTPAK